MDDVAIERWRRDGGDLPTSSSALLEEASVLQQIQIYTYIYIYVCVCMYIYIYMHRCMIQQMQRIFTELSVLVSVFHRARQSEE